MVVVSFLFFAFLLPWVRQNWSVTEVLFFIFLFGLFLFFLCI